MGVVYVLIGLVVFAVAGAGFFGLSLMLTAIDSSFDRRTAEHIGLIPVGLVMAYFIGYAVKENYLTGKKS